ncbi:MAG: hypothetical protein OXN27_12665 [Candidatus Poribacteria bacterium]|nr:hypothetical protein [Candidatus Poribacteria bacterium]
MPALPFREIIRLRYHLDIPGFIRAAIRNNLDKEKVLIYLEIIVTSTRDAIEKMGHFVEIAKHEDLTRDEILAWLHLSYGGQLDPEHLSDELSIPLRCAENVLAGLEAKGIIEDDHVL